MTDLDKLIEAVEGGDFPTTWEALSKAGVAHNSYGLPMRGYAWSAFNGSLDAAKALHEALLSKDCHFNLMDDEDAGGYQAEVYLNGWQYAGSSCPARAWLIAILKAYRAQVQS